MRRRDILALLGGASLVRSLTAHAQQPAIPVIGFLSSRSAAKSASLVAAFHTGLVEGGYIEGQGVYVEYRWADNKYDRLPALAADLVRRHLEAVQQL